MTARFFKLVVVMLSLLSPCALAAVPGSLDYQGYLTDPSGQAIDADISIDFAIYTVELGGSPLWTDTRSVSVEAGLFSTTLGSPLNPFPPGLFDTPLYLGISVAGDVEMTPRRPLAASAFAFKADDADKLQGNTAAELDQSAAVAALEVMVLQLDTVLGVGGGGEARIVAPGGLEAANSATGPDLVVGGLDGSSAGDDGVIASAPALPGSDLIFQTNDAFVVELDNDGNGEDADFVVIDKDDNEIFNIEEDGQVRLHGATSLTAGDDPTFGPVLTFLGQNSDQAESGRIRFREGTTSTNLRGGYVHYDGAGNKMHIGVHDASDANLANDEDIITIERASGQVGIGTTSPTRELTVGDTDGSGDAVINVVAPNRELIVGVNQSSGGIIGTLTNNDLQLRTNDTTRLVIQGDGDVTVRNDIEVEGEIRKQYSNVAGPAAPFALGKVKTNGAIDDQPIFAFKTANVTTVEYDDNGVNSATLVTIGDSPCAGTAILDEYIVSVTSSQFSGTGSILAFVVCVGSKPTLRVRLRDGLGFPLNHGFDFVLYRF